jgi:hypothetical protein
LASTGASLDKDAVAAMSHRCYYLDSADHVAAAEVIACDTDALAQARADIPPGACGYPGIEVWDRDEMAYRARKTGMPAKS